MKVYLSFIIVFSIHILLAQDTFEYLDKKYKIKIKFELSNNLIVVPVEINQKTLNFILDTGVDQTIIFTLSENEEILLKDTENIKLKGLGNKDFINGLYSKNNKVALHKNFIDVNHGIIIVLDDMFNISSTLGIPINGIIGSKFFKNHLIEIDYLAQKIYIYKNNKKLQKIHKNYQTIDFELIMGKPYFNNFKLNGIDYSKKLLIDLGNSDALWLFKTADSTLKIPKKHYDDYLGTGFSGEVYGKRGKTLSFEFNNFKFQTIYTAFPDSLSLNNVELVQNRVGSIGGEILKRFSVVFNYPEKKMYLKKNRLFKTPFIYNISGIDVQQYGKQWVMEEESNINKEKSNSVINVFNSQLKYKFVLKPKYNIVNVRKNSPAANSGLQKDDIILSINNKKTHLLTLKQINNLLKDEVGTEIKMTIERSGKEIEYKFNLEDILN